MLCFPTKVLCYSDANVRLVLDICARLMLCYFGGINPVTGGLTVSKSSKIFHRGL